MDKDDDLPKMPGYVTIKEAGKILNLSGSRVYDFVEDGRLPAVRSAHVIMIALDEVYSFKRKRSGRPRKRTPAWHKSLEGNKLIVKRINVQLLAGQQTRLMKKLDELRKEDEHIFPGTIWRYIARSEKSLQRIEIELVWRKALLPDNSVLEEQLEDFRQALSDVLDWKTAQYETSEVLIHA